MRGPETLSGRRTRPCRVIKNLTVLTDSVVGSFHRQFGGQCCYRRSLLYPRQFHELWQSRAPVPVAL